MERAVFFLRGAFETVIARWIPDIILLSVVYWSGTALSQDDVQG